MKVDIIELLIVVGIVAAIAVPGLLRARMSGNEASAIWSMRAINSSQSTYAASCGSGFYAPTLVSLGTAPTVGGGDGFVETDLNTDRAYDLVNLAVEPRFAPLRHPPRFRQLLHQFGITSIEANA